MKYLSGIALGLLLLCASVAKADGFNPADVYPGEVVFDYSVFIAGAGEVSWAIEVLDTQPAGADFWGFCRGPINPATGTAFPYCSTDEPIQGFEPAGAPFGFDIVTQIFGFDPGLVYPPSITTPEPSTRGLLLVAACFLFAFVALGRRMA
jgi:hypothetical protein